MDQPHRDPGQIGYRAYTNFQRRNGFVDKPFNERASRKGNKRYDRNNEHHQKMLAAIHENEEDPEANAYFYNLYGFSGIPRRGEGTVIRHRDGTLPPNLPCHDRQKAANKNSRPCRFNNPIVTLAAENNQVTELSEQVEAPVAGENQATHMMENDEGPTEEGGNEMVPELANTLLLLRLGAAQTRDV
ncbi:hypothetical protein IFR05_002316 [Cadophora sp. M221]|nr:hypothetical protein IFR05_002316 [Cadophora sp. M221]